MDAARCALQGVDGAVTHGHNPVAVAENTGSAGSIRADFGIHYGKIAARGKDGRTHAVKAGGITPGGVFRVADHRCTGERHIPVLHKKSDLVLPLRINILCEIAVLLHGEHSLIFTGKTAAASGHSSGAARASAHAFRWCSHPVRRTACPFGRLPHAFGRIAHPVGGHLRPVLR